MKRIENLISSWKPTSQTSAINRNAGIKPLKVDDELLNSLSALSIFPKILMALLTLALPLY